MAAVRAYCNGQKNCGRFIFEKGVCGVELPSLIRIRTDPQGRDGRHLLEEGIDLPEERGAGVARQQPHKQLQLDAQPETCGITGGAGGGGARGERGVSNFGDAATFFLVVMRTENKRTESGSRCAVRETHRVPTRKQSKNTPHARKNEHFDIDPRSPLGSKRRISPHARGNSAPPMRDRRRRLTLRAGFLLPSLWVQTKRVRGCDKTGFEKPVVQDTEGGDVW